MNPKNSGGGIKKHFSLKNRYSDKRRSRKKETENAAAPDEDKLGEEFELIAQTVPVNNQLPLFEKNRQQERLQTKSITGLPAITKMA